MPGSSPRPDSRFAWFLAPSWRCARRTSSIAWWRWRRRQSANRSPSSSSRKASSGPSSSTSPSLSRSSRSEVASSSRASWNGGCEDRRRRAPRPGGGDCAALLDRRRRDARPVPAPALHHSAREPLRALRPPRALSRRDAEAGRRQGGTDRLPALLHELRRHPRHRAGPFRPRERDLASTRADRTGARVMGAFQIGVFLLVAVSALGVVRTRDPLAQAVAGCFYGLVLALLFFLHQVPDVALSQIVVGAVALPLMILLALARIHAQEEEERGRKEEERGK